MKVLIRVVGPSLIRVFYNTGGVEFGRFHVYYEDGAYCVVHKDILWMTAWRFKAAVNNAMEAYLAKKVVEDDSPTEVEHEVLAEEW